MDINIEALIAVIGLILSCFAYCIKNTVKLTSDLSALTERYNTLEAVKFSQDERMDKFERKQTEMDKEMGLNSYKLDTVLSEVSKISTVIGKIFDIMDTKQNKVAV